ncbi:MAG: glycosyltransferase family 87 protein [Bryobacteraceae bacterium]
MDSPRNSRNSFVWVVVVALAGLWIALGTLILPAARSHDFLNLYTGASLALDGQFADLHDPAAQLERERRYVPGLEAVVPFVRPAFYALMLAPMALLPFPVAFVVWIGGQIALLAACCFWAWRRFGPEASVFTSFFLPAPLGIASGQDCVVLLALLILSYELAERGRPAASGAAMAMMLIKFHLILLWPLALAIQRRWRMLAAFCAVAAAEVLVCLTAGGMAGIRTYLALLQNKDLSHLSPSPERMIGFEGLVANLEIHSVWGAAAIVAGVIAIFAFAVAGAPLWRTFVLAPAASLLVVPHVYGYDAALLLLPVWLTIFRSARPASRIAATLLATPIPFAFALAGKPWAVVSSASLLIFFLILSSEARNVAISSLAAETGQIDNRLPGR